MGPVGGHDGVTLPSPLEEMQQRAPLLLIFLRHFG
jgi:hypothetical protein